MSMRKYILLILLCGLGGYANAQTSTVKDPASSGGKLFGEALIATNYIEYGLTQTQKEPAFVGGIGYQFNPIFKMGIRGGSVNYADFGDHLNLRYYGEYKSILTANTNLVLKYVSNKYYNSNSRNGNILGIDFDYSGYHCAVENNDNWEGTGKHSTHIHGSKQWALYPTIYWGAEAGINLVKADGKNTYFDGLTYIGHKMSNTVDFMFKASLTTSPSQFDGQGDFATFFTLSTLF